MNYFKLAYTTSDVLGKIKEAEKRGDFNAHIDPIDYSNCLPVDESFPYIPTGRLKLRQALIRIFIISPFMWIVNRFIFRTKIYRFCEAGERECGKYNTLKNTDTALRSYIDRHTTQNIDTNTTQDTIQQIRKNSDNNIKDNRGMIITCNHINKLDALVVRWALKRSGVLRGRQLKVMVADFNNQRGRLGEYMRAFGIMPFPSGHRLVRNFDRAVSYYLELGDCILVFPEQSEWWGYDRPRPLKNGAFYYAVKNNVPVLPLFITCRGAGAKAAGAVGRAGRAPAVKYFDVHIADVIKNEGTSIGDREKIKLMKEKNSLIWQEIYLLKEK